MAARGKNSSLLCAADTTETDRYQTDSADSEMGCPIHIEDVLAPFWVIDWDVLLLFDYTPDELCLEIPIIQMKKKYICDGIWKQNSEIKAVLIKLWME